MGDKVRIGRYDAVGKLCEVIEVDEECVEIDVFVGKVSINPECEELWERLRGWELRVIKEEEEEEE